MTRRYLKLAAIGIASLVLVGAGATIAVGSKIGLTSGSSVTTQYEPKEGDTGCTPGYWKNNTVAWTGTGYSTTDLFDEVFGVNFNPSLTLLGALELGGGGFNALARHAAAALLNSTNPNVTYGLTTSQIIAMVQKAFKTGEAEQIKNELAAFNETKCPIDAHGLPTS